MYVCMYWLLSRHYFLVNLAAHYELAVQGILNLC